ncbi:tubulin epsilon and delta complex protein 1 [Grammomys surdaster]|uniref:tubulin epsilon and delta complex protein 1 n=1 Tax=Grammomys surdaster TaxID=491861 RepID=UPI0010A0A41B|nr:tubulin epsilon and delta complex protein 1 [Grammomys surdaster]
MGRRRSRVEGAARALPEAVAALSRSLPAGPSPEIFRRAKFDRPEAAPVLWQLLLRVLSSLAANNTWTDLAPEAQVRVVKSALESQGYPRSVLLQFPDGSSQGSRELLLALSWLLARRPLLEQLLAQTRVQLGDQLPQCEALTGPGPPTPFVETKSPVDLRLVQWLMGKLRFRWRCLISSQREQCALLSKIHLYTQGCHSQQSLGHLSVAETEMLRDPESCQQVGGLGQGPEWSNSRKALQDAVEQELAALQGSWEQCSNPAHPQRPHRLVRSKDGAPRPQGLQAAEMIRTLSTKEARLKKVLRQLQHQCQQELARLAGALPGLIWVLPPGH